MADPAEGFGYGIADQGFNCLGVGVYQAASTALAHGRALQFFAERLLWAGKRRARFLRHDSRPWTAIKPWRC
jgi:hypothetical protein